ncbi:hypothetical protein AALN73_20160 [Bacteroides stercorirosoris]|uniref:Uncharacterized protein n=1 Tax=Bacteroides stercorirosoris TaxID=871324 RepID=A0A413H9D8_9BACE|nr:hypothetical protein [Bacteroides stercorirosoris]RGX80267.1 hypothetical protein DXA68_05085 [Bacteroides stercorirosoris]
MNDTDCLFDDLLCRSLSLFHQFRLYDDCVEEDNAFKALREAEKIVSNTRNGICVAKLGCVIECLAHRFYIDDDTDGVLGEVDTFLIKFSKGLKHPSAEAFVASLWMGEYFLLRLKNPKSRTHSRSKKMVSKMLSFMADMLHRPEKQKELCLSSNDVFEETVDWVKEVCDMHICEKQMVLLLERLYSLQEKGMLQQGDGGKNTLRQQIWDFYY